MAGAAGGRDWLKGWAIIFLPSLVVLLFSLLHRFLSGANAAGLSFLAVLLLALLLVPRIKVNFARLVVGVIIALALAYALTLAGGGRF